MLATGDVLIKHLVGVVVVKAGHHCDALAVRRVPGAMRILKTNAEGATTSERRIAVLKRHCAYLRVGDHDELARLTGQVHHLQVLDRLA